MIKTPRRRRGAEISATGRQSGARKTATACRNLLRHFETTFRDVITTGSVRQRRLNCEESRCVHQRKWSRHVQCKKFQQGVVGDMSQGSHTDTHHQAGKNSRRRIHGTLPAFLSAQLRPRARGSHHATRATQQGTINKQVYIDTPPPWSTLIAPCR